MAKLPNEEYWAEVARSELPPITEVERFEYKPGDRFIVHIDADWLNEEMAHDIARRFRVVMQLPEDTAVVILGRDSWVEIIAGDQEHMYRSVENVDGWLWLS